MNDFNISTLCTLVLNGNEGLTDNEVVGIGLILYIFGILVFRYKAIFSISLKRLESEVDTFEKGTYRCRSARRDYRKNQGKDI